MAPYHAILRYFRTIVKPLWQLAPSEAKKPSNISRTKNVALKLPKISLTKGYFGQFKGYIFAVLGHFCFLLRLGGCGSQGLYNRSKRYYRSDTPYRAIRFWGGYHFPEMVRYPPLVLSFTKAHLCDTPFCNISRDNSAIPHKKGARKSFAILSLQVSGLSCRTLECGGGSFRIFPTEAQGANRKGRNTAQGSRGLKPFSGCLGLNPSFQQVGSRKSARIRKL